MQIDRNILTNFHTNISINLSVRQPIVRIGQDVGHANVLPLVLAVFSKPLPCNHDWYRRLCDEIVTKGSEQDTALSASGKPNITEKLTLSVHCGL
jgi:hypothetical protein